ncbi:TonB-dependent receptor plug domain-containing protein [Methylobacterium sp. Leaf102]|uniref:TonB-dependent receptor plug domain-containing protein n=2 Tax=unclassified Methylobacterium TaxID=2615210 RepID=UPI001FCCCE96|nr:TonB-dependent receptor plug domain-containing protein [Methylobacterium sp. Leaf102]
MNGDTIPRTSAAAPRAARVMRNTVALEDGFPLIQPDGVSRLDPVDPRTSERIDVFRGSQSALFGNYSTGGAIALRTRTGREIDGYEVGTDPGQPLRAGAARLRAGRWPIQWVRNVRRGRGPGRGLPRQRRSADDPQAT